MMQTTVLDEAARLHPNSWWWLKGDGTDINAGLGESMKMEWSGDVDLNNGDLQRAYELYQQELRFIASGVLKSVKAPMKLRKIYSLLGAEGYGSHSIRLGFKLLFTMHVLHIGVHSGYFLSFCSP